MAVKDIVVRKIKGKVAEYTDQLLDLSSKGYSVPFKNDLHAPRLLGGLISTFMVHEDDLLFLEAYRKELGNEPDSNPHTVNYVNSEGKKVKDIVHELRFIGLWYGEEIPEFTSLLKASGRLSIPKMQERLDAAKLKTRLPKHLKSGELIKDAIDTWYQPRLIYIPSLLVPILPEPEIVLDEGQELQENDSVNQDVPNTEVEVEGIEETGTVNEVVSELTTEIEVSNEEKEEDE